MTHYLRAAENLWLAQSLGSSEQDVDVLCQRVETWLCQDLRRSLDRWNLTEAARPDDRLAEFVQRSWRCLQHHWQSSPAGIGVSLTDFLGRLDGRRSPAETAVLNILDEVVLAQAMQYLENQAMIEFERHYLPNVRQFARRLAGERGVDAVEGLTSDLILPRGERPPKIASFQGRTSLASWLRAVVSNLVCSLLRKPSSHHRELTDEVVPVLPSDGGSAAEPCERLLRPLFQETVRQLQPEDRLLIKMLLLDDVPQKDVARVLRIHSGNITRRRQRIAESVWEQIASVAATKTKTAQRQEVDDCLELILAGDDVELRRSLGEALAGAIRGSDSQSETRP